VERVLESVCAGFVVYRP